MMSRTPKPRKCNDCQYCVSTSYEYAEYECTAGVSENDEHFMGEGCTYHWNKLRAMKEKIDKNWEECHRITDEDLKIFFPELFTDNGWSKFLMGGNETMTNEWISVKEKMPDEEQDVLLIVQEIEFYGRHLEKRKVYYWIYTGWYVDGKWATTYCFGHKYIDEEVSDSCELSVTYWMPFPELPNKNKESEQ